jgi:hypothetical protein
MQAFCIVYKNHLQTTFLDIIREILRQNYVGMEHACLLLTTSATAETSQNMLQRTTRKIIIRVIEQERGGIYFISA